MINNLKDEEFIKEAVKSLGNNKLPPDFNEVLDEEMKAQHEVLKRLDD